MNPTTTAPSLSMLLGAVEDVHAGIVSLEIDLFRLASEWAAAHPGDEVDESVPFGMRALEVAGDGAPTVGEECIAEFAHATARSTDSGKALIGDAVECRWRLPDLWDAVMSGVIPVWKARRVVQQTRALPEAGARFVDTQITPVLGSCTWAQIERTVAEAMVRFDPAAAEAERIAAAEARRFDVRLNQVTYDGIARVDGALDLADATLLEEAIAAGAAHLAELGSTETLNVRRSQAVGLIARHALTGQSGLDLTSAAGVDLMVYVHLDADPRQPDGLDPVARVEHTGSITATEQVKTWCQTAGTRVTVRPVIDLNENLHTDSYQPTPLQREQAILTNPTCIHPTAGGPPDARTSTTCWGTSRAGPPSRSTSPPNVGDTTGSRPTPTGPCSAPDPPPSPGPRLTAASTTPTPPRPGTDDEPVDPDPAGHHRRDCRRAQTHHRARTGSPGCGHRRRFEEERGHRRLWLRCLVPAGVIHQAHRCLPRGGHRRLPRDDRSRRVSKQALRALLNHRRTSAESQ